MALMLGKLFEALRSGGTPEDKAREAAEEVAAYEGGLASVETRLSVLTWMVGANIALTIAIMVKLFQ
ncbi:MAG TPA: hypothetical protein VIJ55_16960 [Acetobacteraceae bacterium]